MVFSLYAYSMTQTRNIFPVASVSTGWIVLQHKHTRVSVHSITSSLWPCSASREGRGALLVAWGPHRGSASTRQDSVLCPAGVQGELGK